MKSFLANLKPSSKERLMTFFGFVVTFALLAAFVFWGTWSTAVAPVMPDAAMTFPLDYGVRVSGWFDGWLQGGKCIPTDLVTFIVSPYLWQELQYVAGVFFAALGMIYFLKGRGLPPLAYCSAGLFLAFSGYWLTLFSAGHVGWFLWMTYGVFAFGLCDRAIRKGNMRYWVLLGADVAWASFWQVDLWLLFTVFTTLYFVWCCIRERKWPNWKGFVVAALMFFVVGSPSFVDAFSNALSGRDKQIAESKGTTLGGGANKSDAETRWVFTTNWSMPPEDTLEFFISRIHGDTSCPMTLSIGKRSGSDVKPYTGRLGRPLNAPSGNYRQHSLYVGWVTCLLAVLGVVLGFRTRTREVYVFTGAALAFWLFSMGRFCEPVYRLVYALPFGDYLRAPVKWHHLTEFCLVVLAGYGLALLGRTKVFSTFYGKVALIVLVVIGGIDLARIAHLYCAPVDITLAKVANPAADEIKRRGGGCVADLVQRGYGSLSWSFGSHQVEVTGNPNDAKTRFIWIANEQLSNAQVREWIQQKKLERVASYAVSNKSMRTAAFNQSNITLFQVPNVPPPKAKEPVHPRPLTLALGITSLLGTLVALVVLLSRLLKSRK